jgi:hypothetical protein
MAIDSNSSSSEPRGPINEWDEEEVCAFFASLNLPQFADAIRGASPIVLLLLSIFS